MRERRGEGESIATWLRVLLYVSIVCENQSDNNNNLHEQLKMIKEVSLWLWSLAPQMQLELALELGLQRWQQLQPQLQECTSTLMRSMAMA